MSWWEAAQEWRSGPWALQIDDGALAHIAFEGRTILRGIRAVLRDRDWATARLRVGQRQGDAAGIELSVHTSDLGARVHGTLRATVSAEELIVTLDLRSEGSVQTNRAGLVVLQPPDLAGSALTVTHPDGATQQIRFPTWISPHQPARNIQGLGWSSKGLDVAVRFDGDVFEMEDQRNWSDASYKTYNRPLDLPFPYTLQAGEHVRQRVRVRAVHSAATPADAPRDSSVPVAAGKPRDRIELTDGASFFPELQLGASTAPDPAPVGPSAPLGVGRVVELDLASPAWRAALRRAASSGLPLDVRIVLAEEDATGSGDAATVLEQALAVLRDHAVLRVWAYQPAGPAQHVTDAAAVQELRRAMAHVDLDAPVAAGVRSHFTELNREQHRVPSDVTGLGFAITPMFHELGTDQLLESVAMQRLIARQATSITSLPMHIGPVTLRPRFNNVATTPQPKPTGPDLSGGYGPELSAAADARQTAPELAAWTIASAAALAVPGVAGLTYFEDWGPRGIADSHGTPYPVATAIEALDGLRGGQLLTGESPDGLIWALGATRAGRRTVLVANLDDRRREITLALSSGEQSVVVEPGSWTPTSGPMN